MQEQAFAIVRVSSSNLGFWVSSKIRPEDGYHDDQSFEPSRFMVTNLIYIARAWFLNETGFSKRPASVGKCSEPKTTVPGKKTTTCHNLTGWFKFWRVILARNLFFWYIICFYGINKLTSSAVGQRKEIRNSWPGFDPRRELLAFSPLFSPDPAYTPSEGCHLLDLSAKTRSSTPHLLRVIIFWIHQSEPDPAHNPSENHHPLDSSPTRSADSRPIWLFLLFFL